MNKCEEKIREIVAYSDVDTALSSMHSSAYRQMKFSAMEAVSLYDGGEDFGKADVGVKFEDLKVSRRMAEAVDEFSEYRPTAGRELKRMISAGRLNGETHLVYGLGQSGDLSGDDYMQVMRNIGVNEVQAAELYGPILKVSSDLREKRDASGLRRILVG